MSFADIHRHDDDAAQGLAPPAVAFSRSGSENGLNSWPLRLLHVEKMESIPRSGDERHVRYGTSLEPAYNVISYTWRPYRDELSGEAITVAGPGGGELGWQVPRVSNDKAFGAEEFKEALEAVADGGDFVWADVACANHAQGVSNYVVEVGKQVSIFKRARKAYVWLHQTCEEDIRRSVELMMKIADEARKTQAAVNFHAAYRRDTAKRREDLKIIERLLSDPWFSSLWTLQDAYIRKDAVILSKEGRTLKLELFSTPEPLNLRSLGDLCAQVYPWIWQPIKTLIDTAGLIQLQSHNPLVLLNISERRMPEPASDKVYSIMQMFGLRLGNVADGVDPTLDFSFEELEDQLSRGIACSKPILSQLFLRRGRTFSGQAWRLETGFVEQNRSYSNVGRFGKLGAIVPGEDGTIYVPEEFYNAVEISPACEIYFSGVSPMFRGSAWSLAHLKERWVRSEGEPGRDASFFSPHDPKTPDMNKFERSLFTDHFVFEDYWPDITLSGLMPAGFSSFGKPVLIADSLESKCPKELSILILGRIRDGDIGKEAWAGLLAGRREAKYLRVGFCTWQGEPDHVETVDCGLL